MPQVVIMDNHSSHITVELAEKAIKHGVALLCLPSKTLHVAQSLDRCVFAALKAA